ncbi:hypothetical protein R6Q57_012963, partial [Mikania cordata]
MIVILNEVEEASSSSPSTTNDHKGADTRFSFTIHLHKALVDTNLAIFLDDKEIETGDFLKPELESAFKASRASIIVLSHNYASSTWGSMSSKQQNSFGQEMEKHKLKMESETNMENRNRLAEKMEICAHTCFWFERNGRKGP